MTSSAPTRSMDYPTGPQPGDGSWRSRHPVPGPDPRSGQPVHSIVRCGPDRCRHPRGPDSSALSAGELFRRTIRAYSQSRTHQPHVDPQPAAPACGARRIYSALQRSTTPPQPSPSPTTTDSPRRGPEPRTHHASTSSRWPDQRVRTSRIKPLLTIGGRLVEPHRPGRTRHIRQGVSTLWSPTASRDPDRRIFASLEPRRLSATRAQMRPLGVDEPRRFRSLRTRPGDSIHQAM